MDFLKKKSLKSVWPSCRDLAWAGSMLQMRPGPPRPPVRCRGKALEFLNTYVVKMFKNATWRWQWAHLLQERRDRESVRTGSPRTNSNTFWDMNYCPVRTDDRRTESDAYEPTVQSVQVGSKTQQLLDASPPGPPQGLGAWALGGHQTPGLKFNYDFYVARCSKASGRFAAPPRPPPPWTPTRGAAHDPHWGPRRAQTPCRCPCTWPMWPLTSRSNVKQIRPYLKWSTTSEFFSSNLFSSDRQTDRKQQLTDHLFSGGLNEYSTRRLVWQRGQIWTITKYTFKYHSEHRTYDWIHRFK